MSEPLNKQFEQLCIEFYDAVYRRVRPQVDSPQAAENITQEVWLDLWVKFPEYDETRPFEHWLSAFVSIKLAEYFRKQRRDRNRIQDPETLLALEETWGEMDLDRESYISDCLKKLPREDQELLRELFVEGRNLTDYETAQTPDYYRLARHVGKLKTALKKCLEKEHNDDSTK